jgi:NAD(P)H-hydrate epimerase
MLRLTRDQVRAVDRIAIHDYHVPGIVLMENAARAVVDAACEMLNDKRLGKVLILCGGGNNGGDGLAVARHLHNRGADVTIALTIDSNAYTGDALINWRIATAMAIPTTTATAALVESVKATLIVDAIFGTGLTTAPREPFSTIVDAVSRCGRPVLSIDLPSGLDCDTGNPHGGAPIRATRTITFVAEKAGFANPAASAYLGQVTVADIGCPTAAIAKACRDLP